MYQLIKSEIPIIKIDFNYYPYKRLERGIKINGVEIDSLKDIGINKLQTIISRTQVKDFVVKRIEEYCLKLTPEHWNGMWYAEGEHNDYSPKKRTQLPLAAFVHMCDVWSARGWYDYPSAENDPWQGATRQRNSS